MANRVILGKLPDNTFGLKVSRPGNNVFDETLSNAQLAFDSRWVGAYTLFMSGTRAGSAGGSYFTVNFGVTLAEMPMVVVQYTLTLTLGVPQIFPPNPPTFNTAGNFNDPTFILTTSSLRLPNPSTGNNLNYYIFTRK